MCPNQIILKTPFIQSDLVISLLPLGRRVPGREAGSRERMSGNRGEKLPIKFINNAMKPIEFNQFLWLFAAVDAAADA